MDGIADLGGTLGWGPVHPPRPDEPIFPEPWSGRAMALAVLSLGVAGMNVEASRHAVERLDRAAYLDDTYFGRMLNGAEVMLTDSAILQPGAIDARARNLRGENVEEPPVPVPHKPDYAATAPGAERTVDVSPAFAPGECVRAKNISPAGHTRLARYVRGHVGVVESIQYAAVFPDTNAHFLGENPQYVYTVRFESGELWPPGPGTDAEAFAVTIELYESYLEKVA